MWVFWKSNVRNPFKLVLIKKSSKFIACGVNILSTNDMFVLIFIYTPPNYIHKYDFWEELIILIKCLFSPFSF